MLDEITEFDGKVNTDDLIYKYKSHSADSKFNKFDNALSLKNLNQGQMRKKKK